MAQSHQRPFSRRQLAVIGKIAFIEAMALSLIIPTISSTGEIPGCSPSNNICNDQIKFIASVFGNDTSLTTNTVTTGQWNAIQNQTMIVVPSIGATLVGPNQVNSVNDTLGDHFTRQVVQQYFQPFAGDYNEVEIWSGTVSVTAINRVTAVWNTTGNPFILQTAIYSGVSGIGNHNSTVVGNGAFAGSVTITPSNSGSWIFGVADSVNPVTCTTIVTSPLFIQRISTCTNPSGQFQGETELSDNATSLRNLFKITFAPTQVAQGPVVAVELVSIDKEPRLPDFGTFCTLSNSPCVDPPITVQVLFIPIVASRSTTSFLTFMYATPISVTSSTTATFQWFAHNATFAFTESGGNSCTIAANALSCSVTTTFPTAFIGTPNVVASSTTPAKVVTFPP